MVNGISSKIAAAACAAMLAVIGFMGYYISHQGDKIDILSQELGKASKVINDIKAENDLLKKAQATTDKANEQVIDEKQKDSEQVSKVRDEIMKKLRELDGRFPSEADMTELQRVRKQQEENLIRADSLWRVYCIRNPQETECAKNAN